MGQFDAPTYTRRWVLAAITIGSSVILSGCRTGSPSIPRVRLGKLLALGADGSTIFYCPAAEMGQDVYTTLAKIFADELGLDWASLTIRHAPHSAEFYNIKGTQSTGGSNTLRLWYGPLRQTAAAVRQAFVDAAARLWRVPPARLTVRDSIVFDPVKGHQTTFHLLAPLLDGKSLPSAPSLRPDSDLRMIGHDIARRDSWAKITGTAVFGAEVRLPGQVYAAVAMIPVWLGKAVVGPLPSGPGIIGTHRFDNAVAVVADTWAIADRAVLQISISASQSENRSLDDAKIAQTLAYALAVKKGNLIESKGDIDQAMDSGSKLSARYAVPYLAHACMETMVATADVGSGYARIVTPSQAPDRVAKFVATTLGLDLDKVTVENTFLGGGFGRKGTDLQVIGQAVALSSKFGRPVQLLWDRETDTRNDLYRPAAHFVCDAAMGKGGRIAAIRTRAAMQSCRRQRFPEYYTRDGIEAPEHPFPYASDATEHRWIEAELPISVGYWRSIDNSHYPFATESFIDELAHASGEDPVAFRLRHLSSHPRLRAVIEKAAAMAGWYDRTRRRNLGIAAVQGWNSTSAQVVQVTIDAGNIRVERVWAAVDCGFAISPQTVRAQIESGIVYGLTAALKGRIEITEGTVSQSNFHDYEPLYMAEMPSVEVALITSIAEPGGVGELGTPPIAPAVANAVFAASGERLRTLPLKLPA